MKKDIVFPEVKDVYVAAIQEWNDDFMAKVWYVYFVNDSDYRLENAIIVSKALGLINGEKKKSSLLRHAFFEIAPVSFVKVELIEDSILALDNIFMVTFFIDGKLYDKNYIFKANSIDENAVEELPILFKEGVIR